MHPRLQQWKSLSWSWSTIVFAVNYWDSMWFHSNGVYVSVRNQLIISSFFGKWPRPKANAEGLSAESSTRWVVWSHCRSIVGYGWIIRWPRLYATKSRISRGLPWPHPVATCLISRISKLQMLRTCKRWRIWQISWQLMGSYFVGRQGHRRSDINIPFEIKISINSSSVWSNLSFPARSIKAWMNSWNNVGLRDWVASPTCFYRFQKQDFSSNRGIRLPRPHWANTKNERSKFVSFNMSVCQNDRRAIIWSKSSCLKEPVDIESDASDCLLDCSRSSMGRMSARCLFGKYFL